MWKIIHLLNGTGIGTHNLKASRSLVYYFTLPLDQGPILQNLFYFYTTALN